MSLYAIVDDEELDQVATIKGWSDFIEWAEEVWNQDNQKFDELMNLVNNGESTNMKALAKQIRLAIAQSEPEDDVKSIALDLDEICRTHPKGKNLMISDGSSDEDDDYDDEDDEDGEDGEEDEEDE